MAGSGAPLRVVLRHGREVTVLGQVLVETVGSSVALALSPGRFPKRTRTVDANEDAVLAATTGDRALLAVADGHLGATAAEAAIAACRRHTEQVLSVSEPALEAAVEELVAGVVAAVAEALSSVAPPREHSGTALSVAVVSGDRLLAVTMGDTAVVRVTRRGRSRRVGRATGFLHARAPRTVVQHVRLRPGERVLCATDGLLDFVGGPWERRLGAAGALAKPPEAAVEALVASAFATGAADHIAVALWAGSENGRGAG